MPPGYYVWDSFGRCTARLLECSSESYPNHETRNPCVAQSPDLIKKTKVEETCYELLKYESRV